MIPFLIIVGAIGWLLAAAGWIVVRARSAGQSELRDRIADLQLRLEGAATERAELERRAIGVEVAHDLARELAAVDAAEAAKVLAAATAKRAQPDAPPMCTGCARRVEDGRTPVSGCSDCAWLEYGSDTDTDMGARGPNP